MTNTETGYPFKLKRLQFPVRLSYAVTINKAQGQTLDRVGIYLKQGVFDHGQLYVACSRARSWNSIRALACNTATQGALLTPNRQHVFTKNIVFREILTGANLRRPIMVDLPAVDDQFDGDDEQLSPQVIAFIQAAERGKAEAEHQEPKERDQDDRDVDDLEEQMDRLINTGHSQQLHEAATLTISNMTRADLTMPDIMELTTVSQAHSLLQDQASNSMHPDEETQWYDANENVDSILTTQVSFSQVEFDETQVFSQAFSQLDVTDDDSN